MSRILDLLDTEEVRIWKIHMIFYGKVRLYTPFWAQMQTITDIYILTRIKTRVNGCFIQNAHDFLVNYELLKVVSKDAEVNSN